MIFVGWSYGRKTTTAYGLGQYKDPHEKMGLALLILYVVQIALGMVAHSFKLPRLFRGHRPPHAYLHAILGLVIFACAQWQVRRRSPPAVASLHHRSTRALQVHYGLYTEWAVATGGLHQVPESAKHAWLALTIVSLSDDASSARLKCI